MQIQISPNQANYDMVQVIICETEGSGARECTKLLEHRIESKFSYYEFPGPGPPSRHPSNLVLALVHHYPRGRSENNTHLPGVPSAQRDSSSFLFKRAQAH